MTAADYERRICQSINKVYGAEKLLYPVNEKIYTKQKLSLYC